MNNTSTSKNIRFVFLVCIVCAITNLSQMPSLVESSMTHYLSNPVWILLFVVCILYKPLISYGKIRGFIILLGTFVFFLCISFLESDMFFSSSIDRNIFISGFVLVVGTCVGEGIGQSFVQMVTTSLKTLFRVQNASSRGHHRPSIWRIFFLLMKELELRGTTIL